jgi:hypothetical protein
MIRTTIAAVAAIVISSAAMAAEEFRCNGTGAVPMAPIPTDPGSTIPTMEWTVRWMQAGARCGELADPKHTAGYCYALGACRRS